MAEPASSASAAGLSQPALESWGRDVGEGAAAGRLGLPLVVALRGPLGAGKSVLARAIARGAGVTGPMPSPTYNLLFTYGRPDAGVGPVVHHLDLYRLEHPDDVWELGWEELGQGEELVLIEWPERAESLLPPDRWEVRLGFPDDDRPAGSRASPGGPATAHHSRELRAIRVEAVGDAPDPPPLPEGSGATVPVAGSGPSPADRGREGSS